eukprot:scaffold957_cov322-Pavlova_lutheri.AAC.2
MGQKTFRTDGFSGSDPEYICQGFERGDSGVTKFREEGIPPWEFLLCWEKKLDRAGWQGRRSRTDQLVPRS